MIDKCDKLYGKFSLNIKTIMDEKHLTISQISRISGLKFEVVQKYNKINIYNSYILVKFGYYLDCAVSDLIIYTSCNEK